MIVKSTTAHKLQMQRINGDVDNYHDDDVVDDEMKHPIMKTFNTGQGMIILEKFSQ